MDSTTICFYVAQVLGSLMGFMYFAGPGLGKLLPFHPMYSQMEPGFKFGMGPFFGMPGDPMRIIIGLANASAGLGMLVALWTPHAMLKGDMVELSEVLLLCASVGLITISIGAAWFHTAMEGNPGPMMMMLPMHCIILGCRLQVTPLADFDNKQFADAPIFSSFPPSTLFEKFILVCIASLALAVVTRMLGGKSVADIQASMPADGKAAE